MRVSCHIPGLSVPPGRRVVVVLCQIAVFVWLLSLTQDSIAMPYPVCEPEDGCGGRGVGLWDFLLFIIAGAISLGSILLLIFGPGVVWNLLRGRKPNDIGGLDQGMGFVFIFIPMAVLFSLPGICAAFLVNSFLGPISPVAFLGILCAWWCFLWWKFVQMKNNSRSKPDAEEGSGDIEPSKGSATIAEPRCSASPPAKEAIAAKAPSAQELRKQKYPDLHPDDVNQLEMPDVKLGYRASYHERMGCCIIRGEPDARAVVVYGGNVNDAKAAFLEWARNSAPSDWNDFLSHGFKSPYIRHAVIFPKSISELERCAAEEVERLKAEGVDVRTWSPAEQDAKSRSHSQSHHDVTLPPGLSHVGQSQVRKETITPGMNLPVDDVPSGSRRR